MPPRQAQVFNGRYEIVRQLARGGMADVFLAHDLLLDRPVALKVLFRELSVDPTFVERFRREAQRAANLTHPNVVSVYDWGEEAGTYFIVMEYVDGRSLASILSEGALTADRAADIGASIAAALSFAHRNGVVHRDVKPGNVMIDAQGHVKVADFGIARAANTVENLTQPGSVMGTATYFSPEQAQGARVDPRSDVYSLGVVLYEMVVGAPPFAGETPVAIAYKHVREEPEPPTQRVPSLPRDYEAVVLRAMAKEPVNRYASADELRIDLQRFRQGLEVTAPATTVTARATTRTRSVAPAGTRLADMADEPPPSRMGLYVGLLLALLLALVGLLFALGQELGLFGGDRGPATVTVPSVVGDTAAQAKQKLADANLEFEERQALNDSAEPGVVFEQSPEADTKVPTGSTVTITVSQGTTGIQVPDVVNETETTARRILERAGFTVEAVQESSPTVAAGVVFAQDPQPGQQAPARSKVRITVSSGKPKVTVPDVQGLARDDAASQLGQAGLRVRTSFEYSDEVDVDKVIRTDPAGGTQVDQGATVTMVVSQGPRPPENVTVPDVVGQTQQEATRTLQNAGFRVRVQNQTTTDPAQEGIVLEQSPTGGQQAAKGSTVTITVGRLAG